MALKKTFTINVYGQQVTVPDAYIKVSELTGSKDGIRAVAEVRVKKDGEFISKHDFVFVPDLDGNNFIAQAYKHAKKQPQFENAQDC
jgi:hypothetical protein